MINVRSDKAIFMVSDNVVAVRGVYDPSEMPKSSVTRGHDWAAKERVGELFKTLIPDLEVGDLVVVESASRTGFSTIKVTEVGADFDFDSDEICRWVTQRIDVDAYKNLREREATAVGQVKTYQRNSQRDELRRQMLGDNVETVQAIAADFNGGDTTE
jgi:hypothetical protein